MKSVRDQRGVSGRIKKANGRGRRGANSPFFGPPLPLPFNAFMPRRLWKESRFEYPYRKSYALAHSQGNKPLFISIIRVITVFFFMLENAHFWSFYSTWFPAFSFHFILQGTIKQCPGKTLPQSSIRKFEQRSWRCVARPHASWV